MNPLANTSQLPQSDEAIKAALAAAAEAAFAARKKELLKLIFKAPKKKAGAEKAPKVSVRDKDREISEMARETAVSSSVQTSFRVEVAQEKKFVDESSNNEGGEIPKLGKFGVQMLLCGLTLVQTNHAIELLDPEKMLLFQDFKPIQLFGRIPGAILQSSIRDLSGKHVNLHRLSRFNNAFLKLMRLTGRCDESITRGVVKNWSEYDEKKNALQVQMIERFFLASPEHMAFCRRFIARNDRTIWVKPRQPEVTIDQIVVWQKFLALIRAKQATQAASKDRVEILAPELPVEKKAAIKVNDKLR